jgi:hypothetical protein
MAVVLLTVRRCLPAVWLMVHRCLAVAWLAVHIYLAVVWLTVRRCLLSDCIVSGTSMPGCQFILLAVRRYLAVV